MEEPGASIPVMKDEAYKALEKLSKEGKLPGRVKATIKLVRKLAKLGDNSMATFAIAEAIKTFLQNTGETMKHKKLYLYAIKLAKEAHAKFH